MDAFYQRERAIHKKLSIPSTIIIKKKDKKRIIENVVQIKKKDNLP